VVKYSGFAQKGKDLYGLMGVNPIFDHYRTQRRLFRRYRLSETLIAFLGE
jgi:hypothetical protein